MKRGGLFSLLFCCVILSWCLDEWVVINNEADNFTGDVEVIDSLEEANKQNLTAFWVEPFWDLDISWNQMSFFEMEMQDYENRITVPVVLEAWETGVFMFEAEWITWEFREEDCLDWGKWDIHYYTVEVSYWEKQLLGCWDDERGVKYSED